MKISVFDLYTIGIGPSSSHTVGPMRAAKRFLVGLQDAGQLGAVHRLEVELFGSLASTGKGHGTDNAILMGLEGEEPETVDPPSVPERVAAIREHRTLRLMAGDALTFDPDTDLLFRLDETLPQHPNGMRFTAYAATGDVLETGLFFSVGGGFVVDESEVDAGDELFSEVPTVPHPFNSGAELLERCEEAGLAIWQVVLANELTWRDSDEIRRRLLEISDAMRAAIANGCRHEGILPGGLRVKRRAHKIHNDLTAAAENGVVDPLAALDWLGLFAIAVNEENAAGGRVVTAPTNGAAGIVPATLEYYRRFMDGADDEGVIQFLLTAGAIGILFKENASISGAEVGCQGEVGVACSMAAAGLAAVTGGSPEQVENAAEIGMEHHLGLTCDPIGGLVQIPCIERNAVGATKALQAARLALRGDGSHQVSLDQVITTMRQTGADMMSKYKETALGGLAVHVVEC